MKQMSYSFQKNIFFVFFLFAAILPEQDTNGKQASVLKTYLIKHRHECIATDCMLGSQPKHSWQLCFPL